MLQKDVNVQKVSARQPISFLTAWPLHCGKLPGELRSRAPITNKLLDGFYRLTAPTILTILVQAFVGLFFFSHRAMCN